MLGFAILLLFITLLAIFKIYSLIKHTNCKSKVCLVGKTALVTGGNSGIGLQIVLALAQRGCRVIIADKTEDEHLLDTIFKETRSRNIVFKYVDLSSFRAVREFAKNIVEDEERLDILVNNAGIANIRELTEDGFDMVMQVNYLSAFLLTHLVLDLLKKTRGRIIFTSSILSHIHNLSFEKLKLERVQFVNYVFDYPNSKLCLIIAADIFAEKLIKYGVTSNSYHPGLVYTNIFLPNGFKRSITTWFTTNVMVCLSFLTGKSAEEGAQTAIHLACANEVESITGEFFFETKPTQKPKLVYNKKFCQATWEATENFVKLKEIEKL